MIRQFFIFLLILSVGAVVALNFKSIMAMGQERIINQQAEKAVSVKNWESAIALYQQGHREHPGNSRITLRLVWLKLMNNQPDEAEALYREVLKNEPEHLEANMGLAALLATQPKHVNQAVILLRQAVKTHPDNPRLIAQIGDLYRISAENPQEIRPEVKQQLYDTALYYYRESLKLNARQFQTQFNVGVSNQAINQSQEAAQAYCKAVALNPASYEARYNLGLVLSDLNYQEEAFRQMSQAVQQLGENGDMTSAQALAIKVQNVKNRVLLSGNHGLSSNVNPEFLEKGCLVQPLAEEKR